MPNNGHNASIGGGGFHHIAIRAYDFDATLKFYMEGLGLEPAKDWRFKANFSQFFQLYTRWSVALLLPLVLGNPNLTKVPKILKRHLLGLFPYVKPGNRTQ